MRLKTIKQTADAATYAKRIEDLTEKLAAQYMREGIPAANATKLANTTELIHSCREHETPRPD